MHNTFSHNMFVCGCVHHVRDSVDYKYLVPNLEDSSMVLHEGCLRHALSDWLNKIFFDKTKADVRGKIPHA